MSIRTLHKGEDCAFLTNAKIVDKIPKKGKQTIVFQNPPHIKGRMSVVGAKEGKGPVGKYFHRVISDDKMGEKTFENAEIKMLASAIDGAVVNAGLKARDIDLMISGDLLNQVTTSNYVARDYQIPYMGVYSACSTMTEALNLASILISDGYFDNVLCSTASHFATAERTYRYPLEYGCQRPPYAQWTVTGAACTVLSSMGNGPRITMGTIGKVVDFGTTDLNNMGAAMAPAAMDSMLALFRETNSEPKDYDLILTGDLGKLGSDILRDLMMEQGYYLGQRYMDCGNMMYEASQKCYQGGSGAACSATVFNSYVIDKMMDGTYGRVAYFATGALMNTQSCYQGETIPCISHGIVIER